MKKIILIIIISSAVKPSYCKSTSTYDREKVVSLINSYVFTMSNIFNFDSALLENAKYQLLIEIFAHNLLSDHYNDLFERNTSITTREYIDLLLSKKYFKILNVKFTKAVISDCILNLDDDSVLLVSAHKILQYKGKRKELDLIIAVSISKPDYFIRSVAFKGDVKAKCDYSKNSENIFPANVVSDSFYLSSSPSGATITIAGKADFSEQTPYAFSRNWPPETYKVTLTKDDYESLTTTITISRDKFGSKNAVLMPKRILPISATQNTDPGQKKVLAKGGSTQIQGGQTTRQPQIHTPAKKNHPPKAPKQEIAEPPKLKLPVKAYITSNVTDGKIYLDGKFIGRTPMTNEFKTGKHILEVIDPQNAYYSSYKEINITEDQPDFTTIRLDLERRKYGLRITSNPWKSEVRFRKHSLGTTPDLFQMQEGRYTLKIMHKAYFPRTVYKRVKPYGVNKIHVKLFPRYIFNVDALYGFDANGIGIGGMSNHFSFSIDYFSHVTGNFYSDVLSARNSDKSFDFDGRYMTVINKKVPVADSNTVGIGIKLGFSLIRPIPIRLHVGYGLRGPVGYANAYKAKTDFSYAGSSGSGGMVYKNEIIKGSEAVAGHSYLKSLIIGAELSLFRRLNLKTDYWIHADGGSDFVFGIGYNFYKKR